MVRSRHTLFVSFSVFGHRTPFLHTKTTARLLRQKSEIRSINGESILEDFSFPESSTENQIELWLDLRGTAVHPQAAIEYLLEQLQDDDDGDGDQNNVIDRVLLSDKSFQNLISSSDPYVETSEVLYVPDENVDLLALSRNGVSYPYGNLVYVPNDAAVVVEDPMQAVQTLLEGKWVVLMNDEKGGEPDGALRMKAVGEFLDIAAMAVGGDWGSTSEFESGLLFRKDSKEEKSKTGGVAIGCSTKSSLMQLASVLRCLQMSGTSTTKTDSGIMLSGSGPSSSSFSTALVLPFDAILWKTASLVNGADEQNSDYE